ncbi:MAG: gliding motility-associated C-terminal domain-containing protein, partial [Bacteroidales bacterium]|nr:gliding motility-associated C-terminal domain-containing protein [Bacteroidales bacterium]
LYKTNYKYEDGEERLVYVSVADKHGCRSYDSVELTVLRLPNAMVCNDPNYPEGCLLFPEFQVEIHDSWGRLVKAMDDGLGWDGTRRGKPVEVGTYYYRVKLPTMGDDKTSGYTEIKGAVTIFTKK